MSNLYEFRVITGCHQGATASVRDGDTLGGKQGCEIILADSNIPEGAVTIHITDSGTWSFKNEPLVSLNKPQLFGDVWVTVSQADQPWPAIVDQDTTAPEEEITADTNKSILLPVAQKPKNYRVTRYSVLFLSVLLSTLAVFTWAINVKEPSQVVSSDSLPIWSVTEVEDIIANLNLSGTVLAIADDNNAILVSGWVANASEKGRLFNAMTKVWPMPSVRVYVQNEMLNHINKQLDQARVYLEAKIKNNTIEVFGVALNTAHLDAAIININRNYPDLNIDSSAVVMADVVMADLTSALNNVLITDLQPIWQQQYLQLDTQELSDEMQTVVSKVVAQLNRKYWHRILLKKPKFSTNLPFGISSVVSGPQPYLVLADGSKLIIGGAYNGVRLIAIKANQIELFDTKEIIIKR